MSVRLALLLCLLTLLPALPAAAQSPVEGVDYVRIADGQRWRPEPGTVEVVEVFAYTCGHCDQFRPMFDQWKRRAARDVRVHHVPAAYDPGNAYARAYFVLEALGRVVEFHPRLFEAVHREHTLPGYNATRGEMVAFLAGEGLDAERVAALMDDPATDERMNAAYAFAVRSGIQGTPTLIINGRYRVLGHTLQDSLRIADALIAMERAVSR